MRFTKDMPHIKKPKFMITYLCPRCNIDSGRTELDPPLCYMCDNGDGLVEIKREPMSHEAVFNRIKTCNDRMMENLRQAHGISKEEWPEDDKQEMMLLEALAKGADLKEELRRIANSK